MYEIGLLYVWLFIILHKYAITVEWVIFIDNTYNSCYALWLLWDFKNINVTLNEELLLYLNRF